MAKLTKYRKFVNEKIDFDKLYPLEDAISLLKEVSENKFKFKQSVDVCVNLGVDTRKSDQSVRGATDMPYGTGRTVRVAVFAQGDKAEAAEKAGADRVGFEDLLEEIKQGKFEYDVVIATSDAMRVVSKVGPILGPRGLMPNPKVGTVAMDVASAVKKAKAGQVRYKADKGGIIHCAIGNIEFTKEALVANLKALIQSVVKAKPSTAKGIYLQKITLTTTMGPGIAIDLFSFKY